MRLRSDGAPSIATALWVAWPPTQANGYRALVVVGGVVGDDGGGGGGDPQLSGDSAIDAGAADPTWHTWAGLARVCGGWS
jgi:hypothetical protein